ncbi:hypothetical protein L1987_70554 [Smallanthus sonchifolius]|uniref:Uncharacterized protein n=1 Tax=Smallanthus sonchifolius TaxID=185202 RepID=A0ACB9AQU5_9ASTR|nr:hypothetical protein L1987_70554 [Smallanthus sonchifolius]
MSGRDRYNVNQWYDVTTKKGRRYRNQQQSFTEDGWDLSFACIGVLSNSVDRVNQKILLKWKGFSFGIMVEEEVGDWIPDCLFTMEEVEVDCIMSDTVVVGEKIGTSQNSGGDSVSEGSQHGGNDLPSNPAIDILTNISDVHEVFSHHLNEGCKGSDKKKKRGKFARKKADTSKSISPSDQERPKKRQRDSGDPFDSDRFIFPVNGNALVENETKDGDEIIHEFLTPDLNRDILDVEVEPSAGRNYVVSEDDHIAAQRLEEVLNEEVNDTINLAKTLGASNIDDFEGDLKKGNVGNGRKVRFWIDPWITDEPLKDLFPDLFRLEKNKWCFVDERIGPQSQGRGITWRWEKYPNSSSEVDALINCHRMVADVNLDEKEDRWFWYQGSSVEFSIKEVRKWLKGADVPDDNSRFMWCKWIPNKCNIFMWRVSMDRIPTQYALRRRNIYVGDGMCVFCGEVEETSDHLFSTCRLVDGVWNDIVSWCKIPPIYVFSTNDVLQIVKYAGGSKAKQDILYGVIILACWRIWKARNKKIFTNKGTNVTQIVSDVKSLGFLWFRSRYKGGSVEWKDWCNFYFPLM